MPGSLAGTRKTRRSTPTSTPAPVVTATHHRLPSNQPGFFGSVNQSFVPPLINPRNASAAKASTTPSSTAYRTISQNPGDRVKATKSEPPDGVRGTGCACSLMKGSSGRRRWVVD